MSATRASEVLAKLERLGKKAVRDAYAPRYGIVAKQALGVSMAVLQKVAKGLGTDHALALSLWTTGCFEARMLATLIDDPAQVTAAQMERWCKDFDNWAICDTACFKLFDRTPHAFGKVVAWSKRKPEFEKRAAYALLASLALHDKHSSDDAFLRHLPRIAAAADDARNFVKKGVSWALRSIGTRSAALHAAARALAKRLASSEDPAPRWVGKDVLRDLSRPLVTKRIAAKAKRRE
ncbi:MAG: DNA alkylation repair protein [Planctomycetes bacterium]|nr:DNA alkylation repair protein [Planctomycetota bacterium]